MEILHAATEQEGGKKTFDSRMSFSSRRRNYLLTPHRRDGLIEWMKSMLQHSFVLDALDSTAEDTFRHFEVLIDEHRELEQRGHQGIVISGGSGHQREGSQIKQSRLRQLVPTIGNFHTPLPLCEAFKMYNEKHRLTKHEIRHILNLAQIMALHRDACQPPASPEPLDRDLSDEKVTDDAVASILLQQLRGPRLVTLDGDQTLYADGKNFESNPRLAFYLYQLLKHGVAVAVVTAAGYEYNVEKYEYRISGLLHYFQQRGLNEDECGRFYLFGGECNYLLKLGPDYRLDAVKEVGPGGWITATQYIKESPGNWKDTAIQELLDTSENCFRSTVEELNLRGQVIRKKRSVGLVPTSAASMTRESLDETVLRVQEKLFKMNSGYGPVPPFCAFNGGRDAWVDVGNKRVGVVILCAYLGIPPKAALHIGDQFLNTGNDYAARDVCPCIWIINPDETTYILKSILRLGNVSVQLPNDTEVDEDIDETANAPTIGLDAHGNQIDFEEIERRRKVAQEMDVFTGEIVNRSAM